MVLLHEDRLGVHFDGREAPVQRIAHRPVGSGPASVEQPGGGQQEGTAAHRGGASGALGGLGQPGNQLGMIGEGADDLRRAGHHQGVEGFAQPGRQWLGTYRQALGGRHQAALEAGGDQAVTWQAAGGAGLGRGPEDRLRAGEVEQAHLRVGEEQQGARLIQGVHGRVGARRDVGHGTLLVMKA